MTPEASLVPGSVSVRRLPVNILPEDMNLFAHELRWNIPETRLIQLENVVIHRDGILTRGTKVLPQSFPHPTWTIAWSKPKSRLKRFIKQLIRGRLFERTASTIPAGIWVTDTWSEGYFHWMTDALPRLLAINDQIGEIPLLLPGHFATVNAVIQSLEPFGVRDVRFVNQPTRCGTLWMPTLTAPTGNYNEPHINRLRELLRGFFEAKVDYTGAERIYISRTQARKRKILNEVDCIRVLERHGFQTHHFEKYAFSQQASIAMNAKYLISSHGAGLTNMLFMQPQGSVLELRKRGDIHNNCYFALSSALDLHYYYQQCDAINPDEDANSADVLVDCELLDQNIQRMLAQGRDTTV